MSNLEARRADVEVQVAIEATQCVRLEAVPAPVGSGGFAGSTDDIERHERPVGMVCVRDAEGRRDQRGGKLRNLVDDDVRLPRLDDLHHVLGPWPELDVHEQLAEHEWPDLRRREGAHLGRPGSELLRASTPSPARNDVKPSLASPTIGSPEANATSCPAARSARANGSMGR